MYRGSKLNIGLFDLGSILPFFLIRLSMRRGDRVAKLWSLPLPYLPNHGSSWATPRAFFLIIVFGFLPDYVQTMSDQRRRRANGAQAEANVRLHFSSTHRLLTYL